MCGVLALLNQIQSLFLLYSQFHGSQRTKHLEIFEFSRADSNTFPLLYITVGKVKINFWNFFNIFKLRVGEGLFFIIFKDLKQLLPRKPCAILYSLKKKISNLPLLNKFFKNIIKIKKFFWKIFLFLGGWGGGTVNFVHSKNSFKT